MLLECPFLISLVKRQIVEVLLLILPLVVSAFSETFSELSPSKLAYCSMFFHTRDSFNNYCRVVKYGLRNCVI